MLAVSYPNICGGATEFESQSIADNGAFFGANCAKKPCAKAGLPVYHDVAKVIKHNDINKKTGFKS